MLVEIHFIQNHAPSNLNRDDTGSPKEAVFGGVPRARISSQCIKRSIRQSDVFADAFTGHLGTRTRRLPALIQQALLDDGCEEPVADAIAKKASGFGSDKESQSLETRQLIFLDKSQVPELARALLAKYRQDPQKFEKTKAEDLAKELVKELPAASRPCVDIALFGRMTTSALFEDVPASLQVAHAISTTRLDPQFDYYTAVDDLARDVDETGAGMIGDVEFNSATYYKYFCIHWEDLVKNLGGDEDLAARAVEAFLRAAALTTPTGKQNSFAAHNLPEAVFVEVKEANVPTSYANAFLKPVRPEGDRDVVEASIERFVDYVGRVRGMYELATRAALWCSVRPVEMKDACNVKTLQEVVKGTRKALRPGPEAGQ